MEGKGSAVITDVIYSSKTTDEVQNPGSKEEYEAMKVRNPLDLLYVSI